MISGQGRPITKAVLSWNPSSLIQGTRKESVIQDEGLHKRQAAKDEGDKSATEVPTTRVLYRVANAARLLGAREI